MVRDFVTETAGAFKAWPRPKPPVVVLLEAVSLRGCRTEAVQALQKIEMPTAEDRRQEFLLAVAACVASVPGVTAPVEAAAPMEGGPSMARLRDSQLKRPFINAPAPSTASSAERGPWEGFRGRLSVGCIGRRDDPILEAAGLAGLALLA